MKKSQMIEIVTVILLLIGGLNWGLIGFFEWNFVDAIFGMGSTLCRIIYSLVGLSALYQIVVWTKSHK
jgi:uncharacterized membrane protein YuzA (DUF378 family)